MKINYLLDCIDRQLTFLSNEFAVLLKKKIIESERNEGLLSSCYGLLTQAKAQLVLLELKDQKD